MRSNPLTTKLLNTSWSRILLICKSPTEPEKPVETEFHLSDITAEGLAKSHGNNPRGLLYLSDELSGWFGSFNRYTNAEGVDQAAWNRYFDGGYLKVTRASRDKIFLPRTHISLAGAMLCKKLTATRHAISWRDLASRL